MQQHKRRAIILLAEDDLGDQELTKRALENGKILNDLFIVENGEELLNYLLHHGDYQDATKYPTPDIILMDLNMPKMDGRQVLAEINKFPALKDIPIIVLTTSRQEEDILRSYDLGVKSFITKPVETEAFFHAIKVIQEYWFEIVVLPPHAK
jgi:CheY-like chemotaxis protein